MQNTATGEQRCFTGVEMLVDFLRVEFGDEEPGLDSDHPDGLLCEQVTISDGSERLLPL